MSALEKLSMNGVRKTAVLGAFVCASLLARTGFAQEQGASPAPTAAPAEHAHESAAAEAPPIHRQPSRPGADLYIGWPQDGTVIRSTRFKVWFGLRNFGVAPAGVDFPNTGHHHLIIDSPLPPMDEPIPNDKNHLHFGLGQTETMLELPPGTHTLQLLLGDENHVPHDPPIYSRKITVYVRP